MAKTMSEIMNPDAYAPDPSFPNAPQDWTRASAEAVAKAEGIALTDDHWAIIRSLQDYFARHKEPVVREIHDAFEEAFHAKGGVKYIYEILPRGPVAQGCRLAGVKAPPSAINESTGSVQ